MFSIRLLTADDATAFWILRQEALGSVPEAFGESVEERYRAATVRERKPKHIWGMYVAPRLRGQGAGEALLVEALRVAGRCEGLRTILLSVSQTQAAAKRLYERLGFRTYGVEPGALRVGDRYLDEEFLALRLY